jgi:hypothetical protein
VSYERLLTQDDKTLNVKDRQHHVIYMLQIPKQLLVRFIKLEKTVCIGQQAAAANKQSVEPNEHDLSRMCWSA